MVRMPLLAALLGLCLLSAMAIWAGTAGADGDGGPGHGGPGSSGGGDLDGNSGPGGGGPGPGEGDPEAQEGDNDMDASSGAPDGRGGDHLVRGQIVVANVDQAGLDVIRGYGFQVLEATQLDALALTIVRLAVPRGWNEVRARDQVAAALPDAIVDVNSLYAMQGDVALPQPGYGRAMIGWPRGSSACGRNMKIGMIDTLVEESQPAFDGARVIQERLTPTVAPAPHGTAIAAIFVSQPGRTAVPGLVPQAELYVAGVFSTGADGRSSADAMALLSGLNWLAQSDIDVVNMSLAGEPNRLVELAIQRISRRGAVFVAAVGNGGHATAPRFPATLPEVISVTAVDSDGNLYRDAPSGPDIDFAAPGVRIWSPDRASTAGRYVSGTSFAAPFVTAAAALAIQNGARGSDDVLQRLAADALDLGDPGKDSDYGWGLIKAPASCGHKASDS